MSADKYQEIGKQKAKVAQLRKDPHLQLCDCCRWDLDLVDEDPISVVGRWLLKDVQNRCERADTRREA